MTTLVLAGLVIGGTVVVLIVGALLVSALEGYFDYRAKPREKMEWCPRGHGYFREKDCIEWSPGHKICPQCWLQTMHKMEGRV